MKKRFLTVVLCLCLVVGLLPATALATSKTADDAINWAKSQVGHSVGYDDGSGYYQCVEFIQAYYQWLGVDKVLGDGADYAANALPSGWTRTPGGTPQKGDILVYSSNPGTVQENGHVAIYESDNALYDQNGSVYGAAVKCEQADYRTYAPNYWGCIHPDFAPTVSEPDVPKAPDVSSISTTEAEPNDALSSANSIPVNQEMSGSLSTSSDKDWFVFQVPGDGYLSITFDHDFVDSSWNYWETTLYTGENKELNSWYWSGNATTAITGSQIGVPAGTYYLCIEDSSFSSATYRFTVNYTSSNTWEKEFNETIVTANQIPTGTEISGSIRNSSDRDWYVFQVPSDGYISLTFDHDFVDSSWNYWETTLYTQENKELNSWYWNGNATTAISGNKIGVPAGTYYLCIKDSSFSSAAYRFTVNYVSSNTWEKEFNETIVTANRISTGTEVSGSIRNSSDVDWYQFEVPEAGMISLTFAHDFVDSSWNYWKTSLFTSANKELGSWTWRGDVTAAGIGDQVGVPAGTYYVRIEDSSFSSATYRFTVNVSEGSEQKPVPANGITLNRSSLSLTAGESAALTATVQPGNATDKTVTWRSENASIATVANGKVTAVKEGSTRITATCGNVTASCTVSVTAKEIKPSGITLNRSSLALTVGESAALTATVLPDNATDKAVTWRSENTSVATVADGKVTAVKEGSTRITATCGNVTAACTVSVIRKESQSQPSGVHFERVNTYFQDQFTDVPANQWYTGNVAEAFELGLMKGKSATTFAPYGDVTIAEAITMAARIHSIYTRGYEDFQQTDDNWYQVYLDYAYENGVISLAYYNCDVSQRASRAQFAEIFAKALPAEGLSAINDVADGAIPDVGTGSRYANYIYLLYRAGILTGSDANGTFNPTSFITRAEAATIVSRMAESNNRQSITLSGAAGNKADSRYQYVVDDCSWTEAFAKALAAGGHLARIDSRQEYNAILSGIRSEGLTNVQFRVGARRAPDGTGYYWVDENNTLTGEEISSAGYWAHTEWFAGEPSFQWDTNSEEFLVICFDSTENRWGWNDVADEVYTPGAGMYGYIVEFNT